MKTIAVVNGIGGSGRTTLTKMFASSLQQQAQARVLLIDLSPLVGGNLSSLFLTRDQIQGSPATIWGALCNPHIQPTSISPSLDLFVGNNHLHHAPQWLSQQQRQELVFRRFFETWQHSHAYDYALIDGNATCDLLTRNAILAADSILLPRGVSRRLSEVAEMSLPFTLTAIHSLRTEPFPLTQERCIPVDRPLDELTQQSWTILTKRLLACMN